MSSESRKANNCSISLQHKEYRKILFVVITVAAEKISWAFSPTWPINTWGWRACYASTRNILHRTSHFSIDFQEYCPGILFPGLWSLVSLMSTTISGLQGFWRLLFHNACTCRCEVLTYGCFTVCKESVIQKVVVGYIAEVLRCQNTTQWFVSFSLCPLRLP